MVKFSKEQQDLKNLLKTMKFNRRAARFEESNEDDEIFKKPRFEEDTNITGNRYDFVLPEGHKIDTEYHAVENADDLAGHHDKNDDSFALPEGHKIDTEYHFEENADDPAEVDSEETDEDPAVVDGEEKAEDAAEDDIEE